MIERLAAHLHERFSEDRIATFDDLSPAGRRRWLREAHGALEVLADGAHYVVARPCLGGRLTDDWDGEVHNDLAEARAELASALGAHPGAGYALYVVLPEPLPAAAEATR